MAGVDLFYEKSTAGWFVLTAYSFGWWLMAGADLFREKSTAV
jgi:hypothetical protein